ncbi:MAG: IS21 family transposase [Deltaproteobacteria bacterium]|nr:IS21 family transposase [Deltaproteobacteria bacterium]
MQTEKTFAIAASKAGMDEKTKLPSQSRKAHTWRTRPDSFDSVWEEMREKLEVNPGLEAKTLFEDLQRRNPGRFADGQLRTLQRRVKAWRGLEGPPKEVFFPQEHFPGRLCESDFSRMGHLGVTIQGRLFDHMIYHFVLTYSNWETGTVCFSESYESLSEGFQNALWELGGVPEEHQIDRMSSAVNNNCDRKEFTKRYGGLLKHYGIKGRKIQTGKANENGDIEQRHNRFKKAVEQALLLRGSRDFESRRDYEDFLKRLFRQLNAGRRERLKEELPLFRRLPERRLNDFKQLRAKVRPSSTIHIQHNTYSLNSRLIGEWVDARLFAERIEVFYGQRLIETMPRLRGEGKQLKRRNPTRAHKEYLKILFLAAHETEAGVNEALRLLIDREWAITADAVKKIVQSGEKATPVEDVVVESVDLDIYDDLLVGKEVVYG